MKLPIIVEEHGDLLVFQDVESACLYLEPVDVLNSEYVAYDAEGLIVELSITEKIQQSKVFGETKIESVEISQSGVAENRSGELLKKISDYLYRVGQEGIDEDQSLHQLVARLQSYVAEK